MDNLDLDGNEGNANSNGGGLRKQLEDALAEKKALAAKLAKLEAGQRASTIANTLKAAQAPEGLARFVEKDIEGDITADAVQKWLTENGSLFNYSPPAQTTPEDLARQEQARATQAATAAAPDAGNNTWNLTRMQNASDEELIAAGVFKP